MTRRAGEEEDVGGVVGGVREEDGGCWLVGCYRESCPMKEEIAL